MGQRRPAPDGAPGGAQEEARDDAAQLPWRAALARFWPLTSGMRWAVVAAVVAYVVAAIGDAVMIDMLSQVVDDALSTGDLTAFWGPAFVWAGVAVAAAVLTFVASMLTAAAAELFSLRLRAQAHAHLLTVPPHVLHDRDLGDLLSRLTDDVDDVENLTVTGVVNAIANTVTAVVFVVAAVRLRWDLALVVLAGAPLIWTVNRRLAGRAREVSLDERQAHGRLTAALEESLANLALVQAYNAQRVEGGRLARAGGWLMRARLRERLLSATHGPVMELLETAALLTVMGIGVYDIATGRLTVGGLLAFVTYLGFLYPPLVALGQLGMSASAGGSAALRLAQLLDLAPQVSDPPAGRLVAPRGELRVERVSMDHGDRPGLRDVSFDVAAGELLFVTGPSGAGKSTLASLLVRFRDPEAGRILLDGTDLREYSLGALRQAVTLLHQEPLMIDSSVEANVLYGVPDAPPEAARAAARAAEAESFIARLPQSWRTRVGQRGRMLSGGQRQRIGLARALLRDGPVLVLDEPTTGLDRQNAQALMRTVRDLAGRRTVIVISHDLDLARFADRVLVLADGAVASCGPPQELRGPDPAGGEPHRAHEPSTV